LNNLIYKLWGTLNRYLANTMQEESVLFVLGRQRFWKAILAYQCALLLLALLYFFFWIPLRIKQFNAVFEYFPREHIKNNADFEAYFG
jgi:type II secretory pathway component PulM